VTLCGSLQAVGSGTLGCRRLLQSLIGAFSGMNRLFG
jgi:hypothetical protein